MLRFIFSAIYAILLFYSNVKVNAQGGESSLPFLLMNPSPRSAGMGESGTGIADDLTAIYMNPGGLAFQDGLKFEISYSKWVLFWPDYRNELEPYYVYLSGSKKYNETGTFSFSFYVFDYRLHEEKYLMSDGIYNHDKWNYYEYSFLAGYAHELGENLGIGLNLKYLRSDYRTGFYSGGLVNSWAFDIGVLYKLSEFILPLIGLDLSNRFSFGLNLANMGPPVYYVEDQPDPLPTNLRIGMGINIIQSESHELNFALDFSRLLVRRYQENGKKPDKFYEAIFTAWENGGLKKVISMGGLEYHFKDPDFTLWGQPLNLAIRTGYYYENPKYGNQEYYTFGGSLIYSRVSFDFSFITFADSYHSDENTYKWGLSLTL